MKKIILILAVLLTGRFCFAETEGIEQAIFLKHYSQAIALAENSLRKDTVHKDKILFLLAEAHIGNSSLAKARESLRSLYKRFPGSDYAKQAVLRIGDTYYLEGNYVQAKKIYAYFLDKYGNDPDLLSGVYLKLAYADEKLGNWDEKRRYMEILEKKFPHTLEASKLKDLQARGFNFVIQVGAFIDQNNALKLVQSLEQDGFSAYVSEDKKKDGAVFYKVRAGRFTRRAAAEAKLEELIKKGYPAAIFP